jgi:hypothetical protein
MSACWYQFCRPHDGQALTHPLAHLPVPVFRTLHSLRPSVRPAQANDPAGDLVRMVLPAIVAAVFDKESCSAMRGERRATKTNLSTTSSSGSSASASASASADSGSGGGGGGHPGALDLYEATPYFEQLAMHQAKHKDQTNQVRDARCACLFALACCRAALATSSWENRSCNFHAVKTRAILHCLRLYYAPLRSSPFRSTPLLSAPSPLLPQIAMLQRKLKQLGDMMGLGGDNDVAASVLHMLNTAIASLPSSSGGSRCA